MSPYATTESGQTALAPQGAIVAPGASWRVDGRANGRRSLDLLVVGLVEHARRAPAERLDELVGRVLRATAATDKVLEERFEIRAADL